MQAGSVLVLLLSASTVVALAGARQELALHPERLSPQDLKLSGNLFDSSQPAVRFVAYEELLELPQQTFSPKDDGNFPAGAVLSGIPLEELIRAHSPRTSLAVMEDCCIFCMLIASKRSGKDYSARACCLGILRIVLLAGESRRLTHSAIEASG